jgi:hypothetical protein
MSVQPAHAQMVVPAEIIRQSLLGATSMGTNTCPLLAAPAHAVLGQDSIKIDMEIKLPQVEIALPKPEATPEAKVKKPPKKQQRSSQLSGVFECARVPEPVYFQSFDCVGFLNFFKPAECLRIIDHAEGQGFTVQRRHRLLNLQWADIVDPFFAEALWQQCGLQHFLANVVIDGMRPCGLNDVIRIQKYSPGSVFGRHTDQHVKRVDGRISRYSLRVFLNGRAEGDFDGGLSAFHVPFRPEPVVIEPETGLALLYPQGEQCTVQEETELLAGCKYILRADILFARPV